MKYNEFLEYIQNLTKEKNEYESKIKKLNKDYLQNKNENIKIDVSSLNKNLEYVKSEINNLYSDFLNVIKFEVDNQLKIECLKQKPVETARADIQTFVAVDEYEVLLNKPIYNFSLAERDELMMMKFKNTSIGAVNSTASKIKGYIDFCVRQGAVPHNQNIFDTFVKSEAKKFVSKHATEFKYITKEKLQKYQNLLKNYQDKLLITLPYYGVRGRTVKGGTLEEIINLKINPYNEDVKRCILTLERNDGSSRELTIPQEVMDLVIDVYEDEEYLPNNGLPNDTARGAKSYKINRCENYVFCALGNNKKDILNPIVINARFQKIQNYCNNQYITVYNLYMSGMITMAMDIYKQKGELESSDYIDICKQYKYGGDSPEKYMSKVKYEVETYLKGGIQNA